MYQTHFCLVQLRQPVLKRNDSKPETKNIGIVTNIKLNESLALRLQYGCEVAQCSEPVSFLFTLILVFRPYFFCMSYSNSHYLNATFLFSD